MPNIFIRTSCRREEHFRKTNDKDQVDIWRLHIKNVFERWMRCLRGPLNTSIQTTFFLLFNYPAFKTLSRKVKNSWGRHIRVSRKDLRCPKPVWTFCVIFFLSSWICSQSQIRREEPWEAAKRAYQCTRWERDRGKKSCCDLIHKDLDLKLWHTNHIQIRFLSKKQLKREKNL